MGGGGRVDTTAAVASSERQSWPLQKGFECCFGLTIGDGKVISTPCTACFLPGLHLKDPLMPIILVRVLMLGDGGGVGGWGGGEEAM